MKIFNQENYLLKSTPKALEKKLHALIHDVFSRRRDDAVQISEVVEELQPMSGEVVRKFMERFTLS